MAEHDAVWLHTQRQVTIVELAECAGVNETVVRELVELGALSPADEQGAEWVFSADCVASLRSAVRLSSDLELETPAMALAFSLLDRIRHLEDELRHVRAQLVAPRR